MIATPEDAEQHQVLLVMRRPAAAAAGRRAAGQSPGLSAPTRAGYRATNRMLPIIPAPPRISSSTVAKLPLRPATVWTKGLDIAVGRCIMSGHHHHGQNVTR